MKRFIFILSSILIWSSCLTQTPYEPRTFDQVDGPEQQALQTFHHFVNALQVGEVKSTSVKEPEVTSIKKMTPMTKSLGDLPLYEISFLSGPDRTEGFAIVGQRDVFDEVLVFSSEGTLSDTSFNVGLAAYIQELEHAISATGIQTKDFGVDMVGNIFIDPITDSTRIVRELTEAEAYRYGPMSPFVMDSTVRYEYRMAEVPTKWGQQAPYNNKVPYFKDDDPDTRVSIGCAAIAIGQLMAYHRYPSIYDWDLILSSESVYSYELERAEAVSEYLYQVAMELNTDWTAGTGSVKDSMIKPALNGLGYSVARTEYDNQYNYTIPFWNIFNEYPAPVLIGAQRDGGGHCWVIDGVLQQTRYYCNAYGEISADGVNRYWLSTYPVRGHLVHCNWGWNGLDDGWYYHFRTDTHLKDYYFGKTLYSNIKYGI